MPGRFSATVALEHQSLVNKQLRVGDEFRPASIEVLGKNSWLFLPFNVLVATNHRKIGMCSWLPGLVQKAGHEHRGQRPENSFTRQEKSRFTWEPQSVVVQSDSFAGLTNHVSTRSDKLSEGKGHHETR